MDEELREEMDAYMKEVMPNIISAILDNEIIKKQIDIQERTIAAQERIANALEALVSLKTQEIKGSK
jgi:hypothetical protein